MNRTALDLAIVFGLGFASNLAANLIYDAANGEAKKNRGQFPIHAAALASAGAVVGALFLWECTRSRAPGAPV